VAERARARHRALEFFGDSGELPETLRAAALYGYDNKYEHNSDLADRSVARHTVVALRALQRGADPSVRDLVREIAAAYAVLLAPESMRGAANRAAAKIRNPVVVEALQVPSMHGVLGLEDALRESDLRSFSSELARARERCDVLALVSQRHGYEWSFDERYAAVSTELDIPSWAQGVGSRRDLIRGDAPRPEAGHDCSRARSYAQVSRAARVRCEY
jgi:hypothetical protein